MMFFALALIAGFFNGFGKTTQWTGLLIAFGAFVSLWTSCYLFNDLSDVDSDRINKLHRPLVKGRATYSQYRLAFIVFSVMGLSLSLALHPKAGAYLVGCWLLGIIYSIRSIRIKHIPGLSLFPSAASFSLLIACGSVLRGGMSATTMYLSVIMFLLVFIAGNAKDLGDVRGDLGTGSTTLPMLIGVKVTVWMTILVSIVIGSLALLSFLFLPLGQGFLVPSSLGTVILVIGSLTLLGHQHFGPNQIRRINGLQAVGAILIMLAYVLGAIG